MSVYQTTITVNFIAPDLVTATDIARALLVDAFTEPEVKWGKVGEVVLTDDLMINVEVLAK